MEERTQFYNSEEQEASGKGHLITIFDGNAEARTIDLQTFKKKRITFGRNKANDIILLSSIVSNFHGYFAWEKGKWMVYDDSSTNGIYSNGQRILKKTMEEGDIFRIDDPENPIEKGVSILYSANEKAGDWQEFSLEGKIEVTIGREESCDICLGHLSVSKLHGRIKKEGNDFYIYNNNSTNGIIVNGKLVKEKERLQEKDVIIITNSKLIFTQWKITYQCMIGGIGVTAWDIVKTVKTKNGPLNISNHICLEIKSGELVAIIGGSGAGKTTFMNCLSGYNRATSGEVLVNGENLYQNYEVLKNIIGYVPQQDIVYDNLKLRNMLEYTARLRMPKDTTPAERTSRVQEVIDLVELSGREDFYIKELSGGQKKRASIAVELLSDPNLFFLDEPSSGLDPGTERNLMYMLQNTARRGKTVILVTHNTLNLHVCDKIIFLGKGGNLCFAGSPEDTLKFFGVTDFVDIYNMVTEQSEQWKKDYQDSSYANQIEKPEKHAAVTHKIKKKKQSVIKQTIILSKRYLELLLNDRQRMLLLIIQAPLLAVLIYLVADGEQFKEYEMTKSILFALSCCAFWIGILNSIQEVCKERVILKREHLSGLRLTSYISSKFVVLGCLCLVQSLLLMGVFSGLVGITEYGTPIHAFIKMLITTFLTSFSAAAMGLFVSCLFHNADRAMTVAPILLMPQILFSGLVFKLSGLSEKISIMVNCRWTMEGYGTIANLNKLTLKMQAEFPMLEHEAEDFFTYTRTHLLTSWGILAAFTLVFALLCGAALKNVDK